jgi:hypothetical protein
MKHSGSGVQSWERFIGSKLRDRYSCVINNNNNNNKEGRKMSILLRIHFHSSLTIFRRADLIDYRIFVHPLLLLSFKTGVTYSYRYLLLVT